MTTGFPSVSPFPELIERAKRNPKKIVLRDHSAGINATGGQLLHSVSRFRGKLLERLGGHLTSSAENGNEEKFVFLIAPPGWEYVVSMLTIFALGAAMSAQCKRIPSPKNERYNVFLICDKNSNCDHARRSETAY